jgi:D-glycero-D-manno-heptose 1,7-bisphosphate phosphatase
LQHALCQQCVHDTGAISGCPKGLRAWQYNDVVYPAIFLDRDGVLIENRPSYVRDWSDVQIFPDAISALSLPAIRSYKIVIVTNQSAIGRGLITQKTADEINSQLVSFIHDCGGRVDAVYMCPHAPEDSCSCRKPKPGLLLRAASELSLDLQRSWMIGDAWSDVQAGQSAGVRQAILVRTGRGSELPTEFRAEHITNQLVVDDLARAIDAILAIDSTQAAGAEPNLQ